MIITLERFLKRNGKVLLKGLQKWKFYCRKSIAYLKGSGELGDAKSVYDQISMQGLDSFFLSQRPLKFESSPDPVVSVILILYNKAHLTLGCLRSLLEIRSLPFEVIIVDNASSDETFRLLNQIDGATLIRNTENLGFLKACNQAAEVARGQHLLFLNNDTVVLPGSLECALETLQSSPQIGAVGARIINFNGKLQEAGSFIWKDGACQGYGRGQDPNQGEFLFQREVDYCSGAFLLTPRALFQKLKGFDLSFVPAYYEETDYCTRLRKQGYRIVYEPRATLLHYEFGSASSKDQAIQLMLAHQALFLKRHSDLLASHYDKDDSKILFARTTDRPKRILFIEDRVPHPHLGAGFPRTRQILKTLTDLGFFITFFPTQSHSESWHEIYQTLPRTIEVMRGWCDLQLLEFLKARRSYYQVIWVSRPHNMEVFQRIRKSHPELFEGVQIVYDAEAVFTNRHRLQREILKDQSQDSSRTQKEFDLKLKEEVQLAAGANRVFSVSDFEKSQFEKFGYSNIVTLGHAHSIIPSKSAFSSRKDFLFVGTIHYHPSPNSDSILWFVQEVLPLISKRLGPKVRLLVAGLNRSSEIQNLASDQVVLLGKVDRTEDLYENCRVFIAPTRFAAGIPYKVHEAAAHGIPVVSTNLIASQLGWTHGEALLSAPSDQPERFAEQCIELYSNEALWKKVQAQAFQRMEAECSPEKFSSILKSTLTFQEDRAKC